MARLVNHSEAWHQNEQAAKSLVEAAKHLTGDAKKTAETAAKNLRKANGD